MQPLQQPLRQTTTALLERAAQDFQAAIQGIVAMALADGEVPAGARLDPNQTPPVWVLPDITPG